MKNIIFTLIEIDRKQFLANFRFPITYFLFDSRVCVCVCMCVDERLHAWLWLAKFLIHFYNIPQLIIFRPFSIIKAITSIVY